MLCLIQQDNARAIQVFFGHDFQQHGFIDIGLQISVFIAFLERVPAFLETGFVIIITGPLYNFSTAISPSGSQYVMN